MLLAWRRKSGSALRLVIIRSVEFRCTTTLEEEVCQGGEATSLPTEVEQERSETRPDIGTGGEEW